MTGEDENMRALNELVHVTHARAREIYGAMAGIGLRIFCVSIRKGAGGYEKHHLIHDQKTVEQWREEVREFLAADEARDADGWADDDVTNRLFGHLMSLGYADVHDLVVDVFEGRITNERARLVDHPDHEEQADGFGHYGWENGCSEDVT